MKISEVLEKFIRKEIVQGSTNATIRHYKSHIGFFMKYFGDKDINKVTYEVYEDYILYLKTKEKESSGFLGKNEKLSGRTIKTYASALKTFLNYAYEEGYLKENVAFKIKMPRYKKKVIQILTLYDINLLINSFDKNTFLGARDLLVTALMLDDGLRLSEVVKLSEIDFNFANNTIKIDGKGQKERLVPLTEFIKECLLLYKEKYYETFGKEILIDDALIRTQDDESASKNTISLIFRRLRSKLGINIHPHLLRHTFATLFLVNGGDINSLQIILGHTTLTMVLNYLHLANLINMSLKTQYSPLTNMKNPIGQKNN